MPGGSFAPIAHLLVDTLKETLGVWTCPSGKTNTTLTVLQDKAQEWIDRTKSGKLMRRYAWFLQCHQVHPKLNYGLISNTTTFNELTVCLKRQWWQLIPLGGIVRTAPREVQQTSLGFCGAGCPRLVWSAPSDTSTNS